MAELGLRPLSLGEILDRTFPFIAAIFYSLSASPGSRTL